MPAVTVRQRPAETNRNFLGRLPDAQLRPFRGAKDTLKTMAQMALGDKGERNSSVRSFTTWVLGGIWPKDYLGEILAIRNCLVQMSPWKPDRPLFRYVNDPRHVEYIKSPARMVEEILQAGSTSVDCDELACMAATMGLCVGRHPQFVAMGFAPGSLSHVGTRVMEPKSEQWIWLDSVAGPREREAASRAQEILTWDLD